MYDKCMLLVQEYSSHALKCTINQIYLSIVSTVYTDRIYEILYALLLYKKETIFKLICFGSPRYKPQVVSRGSPWLQLLFYLCPFVYMNFTLYLVMRINEVHSFSQPFIQSF